MIRDIKFRVFAVERGTIHRVNHILFDVDGTPERVTARLRNANGQFNLNGKVDGGRNRAFHLMQYTGLKDKNGVEIYEGDIVRVNDDWDEPTTHEVKWGGDYPAFEIYPGFDLESNNLMSALEGEGGMTVEVIGNIYENPELLEAKS